MSKPTIILASPGRLFRESLSEVLHHHLSADVIQAGTGEELFTSIDQSRAPLLLIDINLPGINTTEIIRHISVYCSTIRTIAICPEAGTEVAALLRKAGAHGCISYRVSHQLLFKAVSEVNGGGEYFPECALSGQHNGVNIMAANDAGPIVALTRKELEIASLVKTGLTTRAIAHQLGLSVSTIELHRYNILRKLKMKRSTSLINYLSSSHPEQIKAAVKAQSGLKA